MANYIWKGDSFFEADPVTQFLEDTAGNLYFYEQNYKAFFTSALDSNNQPQYSGNTFMPDEVVADTQLSDTNYTLSQVNNVATVLLNGKLNIFKNTNNNVVNAFTQNPSSFVGTTVTENASGGYGTSEALKAFAPYLANLNSNFGMQEVLKWANGPQLVKKLSELLNNHQNNINIVEKSAKAIVDFKKKLLRRQVALGDSLRQTQNTTETFLASGSFDSLQSAFPTEFSPLKSILHNSNSILSTKMSNILPNNLGAGNVQNIISGAVSGLFGNSSDSHGIPNIVNPMDKFVVDIGNLTDKTHSIFTSVVNQGFDSLQHQIEFTNQAVNMLNNIVSQIPVVTSGAVTALETDADKINTALKDFYKAQAQKGVSSSNPPSVSQKAVDQLYTIMKQHGPPIISNLVSGILDVSDPAKGGSILNLSGLSGIFGGEQDPSIVQPNIVISPDPSIAQAQNEQELAKAKANQPSINQIIPRGSGFNQIEEVGHRPRNNPVNGLDGDYHISTGVQI